MELFISKILVYVELAYYIGGLVIAICAVYATKQISLMKQSIIIQSKRESLSLESIPLVNELYKLLDANNIEFFADWQVLVEDGKLSVINEASRNYSEIKDIKFNPYLNSVESVAVFFNSGVADDHVGYNTLSYTLLNTLTKLMPIIYYYNKRGGYYSNIIELYIRWQIKANHETFIQENEQLQVKIRMKAPELKEAVGTKIRS